MILEEDLKKTLLFKIVIIMWFAITIGSVVFYQLGGLFETHEAMVYVSYFLGFCGALLLYYGLTELNKKIHEKKKSEVTFAF